MIRHRHILLRLVVILINPLLQITTTDGLTNTPPASSSPPQQKTSVVVIGGGWAGYSCADALSLAKNTGGGGHSGFDITILEASPRGPGGLAAGWKSPKLNRTVEAGIHGFWRDYANVFAVLNRLRLDLDETLTPYTPSVLVSSKGRVALAPVLGESQHQQQDDDECEGMSPSFLSSISTFSALFQSQETLSERLSVRLPPPLDLAFSTFDDNSRLSLLDRVSGIGLLGAWADFGQEDRASWDRYDRISADNLFNSVAGVSPALYDELISPLLHVLPMTPGYDCSAAAALSCLHVFALRSKGAFDVRWCRGSITDRIFNPWTEQLQQKGVKFRGGAKVTSIIKMDTETANGTPKYKITVDGSTESIECNAVALAIGGTALKRLLPDCPPLSSLPGANGWKDFRGVTCVATRLFFKQSSKSLSNMLQVGMKDSPVFVCGPKIGEISELTETGFCLYDLERLQGESFAIEVDYFRADTLAGLSDDEVVDITLKAISAATQTRQICKEDIADVSVVRARDAVSHFCVNSLKSSPEVRLSRGLYICGDYVDRTGHASWSTEKSVVTGIQAAKALCLDFGAQPQLDVLPPTPDTAQLKNLQDFARSVRKAAPFDFLPESPWRLLRM